MNHDIFQSKLLIISVIFLFILLISSDVLPKSNVSAQRDVDRLIREGKELYKNGEYREAIVKFLEAKDLARTREEISDVYFNLSSAYYASNQSVEAKQHLQKSLETLPERTIDALYYSADFVEMFNETKAELIKLKEKEKRPVVKAKPAVEKKVKKGGGGFLLVIGALVIGGGAAALLLMGKKSDGGDVGNGGLTTGSIQVSSSPTGAQVFLDGSNTGSTTNTTLTNVSPGSHTVSLIKEGYENEQRSVSVTAGQTATVSVTLTKPTITVIELPSGTVWATGEEVEIKWDTSGSAASRGVASTGAGLNSLTHQGRNVLFPFQRRAFQERRFLQNLIKERRSLEDVDSSGNRGILSSNTSEPQGISREISSSVKEGDIGHKRARDIRDIKRNSRVRIINAPVGPRISNEKFTQSGDIRLLGLSYVKIELYKGSTFNQTIVSSTENDGSYMWTVDSSLEDGTDYKIRISNPNDSTSYGESEGFEINRFQDIEWVQIASGNFQMGDNFNEGEVDELPVHTVYLDAYYISKYEVTFEQYDAFCDATSRTKPDDYGWGRGDRPVVNVNYADVTAFCSWMSGETGENIHLPTEAQWEKAARGTDQRKYPWGSGSPTSSLANYNNYVGETMPVGSYPSGVSPYGVHDMAGNVFEWCSDWYDANYYSSSPINDPQGASSGTYRIFRGGSWYNDGTVIRSANRPYNTPDTYGNLVGFRVCKDVSVAKSITVTSPTSGDIWSTGQLVDITWTSTGTISNYVDLDVYKGTTVVAYADSTENDGIFPWLVDSFLVEGTDYKIRISDETDASIYGESDIFTINHGYEYVHQWGSYGIGDGLFDEPCDVAVDSSGNVYVTDSVNHRIQKFTSGGTFVTKWGSSGIGDGEFSYPYGVAVDSSNNVYVTDYGNNRIQKFTSSGGYLTQWGSYGSGDGLFDYPAGIAVDSSGNVYVVDNGNNRIQKFTSNGTFVTKWGSYGSGDGQFDYSTGIAVDSSGYVYVAEQYNHRIQKFTSNGTFVTKWGSYGSGDGQFDWPAGIAVDSSGNVYVSDSFNDRIQKFRSDGTWVTKWGSYGSVSGEFNWPEGITVDSSGNVYVSDFYNDRIQKFQPIDTSSSLTLNNPRVIKSNLGTIKSSKTRPNKSRPPLTRRPRTTRNKK